MTSQTSPSDNIALQVNGETKSCPVSTSLADFLVQISLNPQLIAIEYNGEILARALWSETTLQPGDRLEIVTIVGGGASDSEVRQSLPFGRYGGCFVPIETR